MDKVVINTDGASRGNPGPAGAGWVIRDLTGKVIHQSGVFLGRRTNNEAEYEAVIGALRAAAELGATKVQLRTDSELLVRQVKGEYRVKNARLAVLHKKVRELIAPLERFAIEHVRREKNSAADAQANEAIDSAGRR